MTRGQIWYQQYRQSEHWKQTRQRKLASVGRKCEACKQSYGLHVHHLSYKNVHKEPDEDLMVLCETCHQLSHDLWRNPPKGYSVHQIRSTLIHFLTYNKPGGNPVRKSSKGRAKANTKFNHLPQKLKILASKARKAWGLRIDDGSKEVFVTKILAKRLVNLRGWTNKIRDAFGLTNEDKKDKWFKKLMEKTLPVHVWNSLLENNWDKAYLR